VARFVRGIIKMVFVKKVYRQNLIFISELAHQKRDMSCVLTTEPIASSIQLNKQSASPHFTTTPSTEPWELICGASIQWLIGLLAA
jgi:hypothetical protein